MLYKYIYKENSKLKNEVIEAVNIEEAAAMASQFCKELNYQYLNICPFVFDIKAYLEASKGGVEFMPNPSVFGQQIERRRLTPVVTEEVPVPAEGKTTKK